MYVQRLMTLIMSNISPIQSYRSHLAPCPPKKTMTHIGYIIQCIEKQSQILLHSSFQSLLHYDLTTPFTAIYVCIILALLRSVVIQSLYTTFSQNTCRSIQACMWIYLRWCIRITDEKMKSTLVKSSAISYQMVNDLYVVYSQSTQTTYIQTAKLSTHCWRNN